MHRYAVLLLCALVAAGVVAAAGGLMAAPAPFPTRTGRASGPWITGWDRVVDPVGDCKFDRRGDRLTMTVPGQPQEVDVTRGRLNGPYLLRDVEGDFVVQVRVGGDFLKGQGTAGLLLLAGNNGVTLALGARPRDGKPHTYCWARSRPSMATSISPGRQALFAWSGVGRP